MAIDIDALVAWGVPVGSLSEAFQREDWEDAYARKMGLSAPQRPHSDSSASEWQEYWRRRNHLLEKSGCVLQLHGDEGQYSWCAIIKESLLETSVSKAPLQCVFPTPTGSWRRQLEEFCNALDLRCPDPGWLLIVWTH